MVLTLTVVVIIDKNGLTKSFLTEDNMAFKINSPFDLSKMNTSVFERDMGEDPVFARTPKNGVIIINELYFIFTYFKGIICILFHSFCNYKGTLLDWLSFKPNRCSR